MPAERPQTIRTRTNWPTGVYFSSLAFGEVCLAIFTSCLSGHEANDERAIVWLAILVAGIGRYILAMVKREQSNRWQGYCVVWLLLWPEWMIGEQVLLAVIGPH